MNYTTHTTYLPRSWDTQRTCKLDWCLSRRCWGLQADHTCNSGKDHSNPNSSSRSRSEENGLQLEGFRTQTLSFVSWKWASSTLFINWKHPSISWFQLRVEGNFPWSRCWNTLLVIGWSLSLPNLITNPAHDFEIRIWQTLRRWFSSALCIDWTHDIQSI